ncbi:hypothetical protein PQR05_37185 [Paraburkholderia sediminicola]|uniref:hypothetical protein n=1 Tax=Paraburkholderia sediminicola TaxID=458836 RepID=UPI0038BC5353
MRPVQSSSQLMSSSMPLHPDDGVGGTVRGGEGGNDAAVSFWGAVSQIFFLIVQPVTSALRADQKCDEGLLGAVEMVASGLTVRKQINIHLESLPLRERNDCLARVAQKINEWPEPGAALSELNWRIDKIAHFEMSGNILCISAAISELPPGLLGQVIDVLAKFGRPPAAVGMVDAVKN